jgi:hypothetical protein
MLSSNGTLARYLHLREPVGFTLAGHKTQKSAANARPDGIAKTRMKSMFAPLRHQKNRWRKAPTRDPKNFIAQPERRNPYFIGFACAINPFLMAH